MTSKDGLPTMTTFTGKRFDFLTPDPETICIEDIAHGLAQSCRFQAQCQTFYSVAHHSVLVEQYVPFPHWYTGAQQRQLRQLALMHDAAEAYMGDICRPLKMLLPDYKVIQKRVEAAIVTRFKLEVTQEYEDEIKDIDQRILANEGQVYMHPDWRDAIVNPNPKIQLGPKLTIEQSELLFLRRFTQLFLNQ